MTLLQQRRSTKRLSKTNLLFIQQQGHHNNTQFPSQNCLEPLFIFVFGVFLLTVGQACLPRERGDLQEEVGVTVDTQSHQDGDQGVENVGHQHTTQRVAGDTERSQGA